MVKSLSARLYVDKYLPKVLRSLWKDLFRKLVLTVSLVASLSCVMAQGRSGIIFPNRLGVSYQKSFGVDLGLVSFNRWNDRKPLTFYDVSLGIESYIMNPFVMAPKISLDAGIGAGDVVMIGAGLDISMPTDFSRSAWMFTPKVGVGLASVLRLYYGRNIYRQPATFPDIGKHRISLEINIAAFHDLTIGL